jgi:tagatose 6-phosphate kinase
MILCICPNPSIDTYAWIDSITAGKVNRIKKEQRFPGGKGVHAALAAAELGEEVHLLAFWGGPTGEWIRKNCEKYGVLCHGPEIADWSRTCFTFKSDNTIDETEILGCGPSIDSDDLKKLKQIFQKLLSKADCVSMSGSWPNGTGNTEYAELIRMANGVGKQTFLDCAGEQLVNALEEKPYAIHVNQAEANVVFHANETSRNAVLLSEKCKYAVVSEGADGLYLASDNEIFHAHCKIENVLSAVGSGDCLLGGLTVAFRRNMTQIDTARMAAACGAANCLRPELGMLYKSDVEKLWEQVRVKRINQNS